MRMICSLPNPEASLVQGAQHSLPICTLSRFSLPALQLCAGDWLRVQGGTSTFKLALVLYRPFLDCLVPGFGGYVLPFVGSPHFRDFRV